jgi:hypothetical protein
MLVGMPLGFLTVQGFACVGLGAHEHAATNRRSMPSSYPYQEQGA